MSAEHLLAEIAPILHALTDTTGGDVAEATKSLHQLVIADPGKTLVLLAQIGAQGVGGFQSDARMIALISLNRLMFRSMEGLYLNNQEKVASTPWYAVSEAMRLKIEDALCHGLKDEMDMKIRKCIALCATRWTEESHARNKRPFRELPAVLLSLTVSSQTWHRFTAYQILAECPLIFFMCDCDNAVTSSDIAGILYGGLSDHSVDTKIEALKAMSQLMFYNGDIMLGDTSHRDRLIAYAFGCIETIPWAARDAGLEPLVELANEKPSLFMARLYQIVTFLLAHMSPDPIDMYEFTTTRRDPAYDRYNWQDVGTQSSELLLALIDGYPEKFLMPDLLKDLFGSYIGAQIMAFSNRDDQELWSNTDPDDEQDYPEYPEEALTRLGAALPSELVLLATTYHARGLLKSKDWRARYCCTMAIACVVSGCHEFVDLRLLLTGMDQCRVDPDARVRHVWLELVYQLSQNPEGKMQKLRMNATVNACKPLLQDPSPRVRAQAARCLAGVLSPIFQQFSSNLKDREHLVDQLFTTYELGPVYVQVEVLKALSTLAEFLGVQCKPLYSKSLMCEAFISEPWMSKLLDILAPQGNLEVRGPAIENATVLVAAVGPKLSANDLAQLGPIMLHYHNSIDETSDEWPILLFSWERLASSLEDAFAPMLPMILPRIMKSASIPPDKDSDPYVCSDENRSKAEALNALWFYASNVPAGFVQYLQPVWHLVLGSLELPFPVEVKKAAFALIPLLLNQIKGTREFGPSVLESIWTELMAAFVPVMKDEIEFPSTSACFVALREVIRVLYAPPPLESASTIFMYANLRVDEVKGLRDQRVEDAAEYPDEDFDSSEVEAEEEELLLDIERACRTLNEFMGDVPDVQAAYQSIHGLIGELVDGQWTH